ncbi:hypothetical protein HN873_013380, partial [Arachis hypogaea]
QGMVWFNFKPLVSAWHDIHFIQFRWMMKSTMGAIMHFKAKTHMGNSRQSLSSQVGNEGAQFFV